MNILILCKALQKPLDKSKKGCIIEYGTKQIRFQEIGGVSEFQKGL